MKIEYADKQNQFFKEMKWWELIVGDKEVKCEIENADQQNQIFKEMKWWEVIMVTKWKMKNWKLKMLIVQFQFLFFSE